ncbi:MAG: hypothetical protein Kow0089_20860 [Desulfobulbaceae bacterium]
MNRQKGLLFPPRAEFPYRAAEFSHTARINSLGFRGPEWAPGPDSTRILAIGDSFTFGMGVEEEQSWTRILEQELRSRGHDVRIANLGRPGADPLDYLDAATRAIPLLEPDLVLVAVLQGDDPSQVLRRLRTGTLTSETPGRKAFRSLATRLYPNTFRLLAEEKRNLNFRSGKRQLDAIWKEQAAQMLADLDNIRKERFGKMSSSVREMFLQGRLNPGIVSIALADPDYFTAPLRTSDPEVRKALQVIRESLESIQKSAAPAPLVVVSVPPGSYVSDEVLRGRGEMGFTVSSDMLRTSAPDAALEEICRVIHTPCLTVTDSFRRENRTSPLYYKYDGHFNARGHEVFARLLRPKLEALLLSLPSAQKKRIRPHTRPDP